MKSEVEQMISSQLKPILKLRVLVMLINMVYTVVGLIQPYILGKILDSLTSSVNLVMFQIIISIIILFISFLLNWLQNYLWFKMIYHGNYLSRSKIFSELLKNDIHYFNTNANGDILNRVINDVAQFSEKLLITFPMLVLNIFTIIVIIFFLFYMNYIMVSLIVILSIIYFFYYKSLNKKLRESMIYERKSFSKQMTSANEALDGINTIQIFDSEQYFSKRFSNTVFQHYKYILRLQKWKSLGQSGTEFLIGAMPLAIVFMGSYLLMNGKTTIGVIFSYVTYLQYIYEPIRNLTDLNLSVQQSKAVESRLQELFTEKRDEVKNKEALETVSAINDITFKNISFSYEKNKFLLKDFNLNITKGQRIAITGVSGIGKSTLIELLISQLNPQQGEILINGINLKNLNKSSYKNRIAVLPQEIFVFDSTQIENISLGKKINEDKITEAIKLSCLDQVSTSNILNYSGGERQRLGLARTFAKDADIIILDEPTSALDLELETTIVKNIDTFLRNSNATLFVVSHRKEILNICNWNIIIRENGKYELIANNCP